MTIEHDFRILGPLEVVSDHQVVPVRAPKLRVLLGALLVHPNKTVGVDDLADRLWEDSPQRNAKATLQTYVWRLRLALGDTDADRVVTTAEGYQVRVEPHEFDLLRFRTLSDQARKADNPHVEAGLLEQALAQWRGRPLEDVASDVMRTLDAPRLEEERLEALERRFDVELRLGRHGSVIGELHSVVAEHPLRERFHGQLMLALYRAGRQGDVFDVYRRLRDTLADQLGIDPTPELRLLHHRILTNNPAIATPARRAMAEPTPAKDVRVPRELPMDIGDFVGREKVRSQIVAQLTESGAGVPLVVISGQPGVGKTALAVNVAHQLRDRFPDGQLYADLREHSATEPLAPVQILPRFLISLGVQPHQVPTDPDELVSRYRTLLADRKVLVLLDNVGTPQQVRPMLPNAPDCGVIVTSRNELRGLTALQGAQPVSLEVLSVEHSSVLLAAIIGPDRVQHEADESREIAELCGHLPLALRIAAANLLAQPDRALSDYAADLRRGNRLAALAIDGDEEATVRATFALSYMTLDRPTARMFRLLGLVPGPDFTQEATAALAGVTSEEAARMLDALATANLVHRKADRRFQLHDLLRLYAAERCRLDDDRQAIAAAKERLFHFYLRCLDATGDLMFPTWLRLPRPVADLDLPAVELTDPAQAVSWMDQDCLNVFAAVVDAADDRFRELAWPMAEALRPYLVTAGKYRAEGLAACDAALRAAVEDSNAQAEAAIHDTMGAVHYRHSNLLRATHHFTGELRAHRASGSVSGQARALVTLGNVHALTGNLDEAADHVVEGLALAEDEGSRRLRRYALLNLGNIELYRGNLAHAEEIGRRNLSLGFDEEGESVSEAAVRGILGLGLLHQGRSGEAVEEFARALELFRRGSISHYEAKALSQLANAWLDCGEPVRAMACARSAVALARDSGALPEQAESLNALAAAHHEAGDHRQAKSHYERALLICGQISLPQVEILSLIGCAESSRASGDLVTAAGQAGRAMDLSEASGFRMFQARAGTVLARTRLDMGDTDAAAALASSAVLIASETGARLDQTKALHVLDLARAAS